MSMSWGDKQAMLIMATDVDPPTGLVRDWVDSALTCAPELVWTRAALVTAGGRTPCRDPHGRARSVRAAPVVAVRSACGR